MEFVRELQQKGHGKKKKERKGKSRPFSQADALGFFHFSPLDIPGGGCCPSLLYGALNKHVWLFFKNFFLSPSLPLLYLYLFKQIRFGQSWQKLPLTVCVLSMWSGLPHFWCALESLGHAWVFHFPPTPLVLRSANKNRKKTTQKTTILVLIPVKISIPVPIPVMPSRRNFSLYWIASESNLENDYIVHVITGL